MKIPQWIKEVWHGDCHSCKFRHCCNRSLSKVNTYCPYWKFRDCYLCKYFDGPDEEWFKRGCEVWCLEGCNNKFKRSWPKTIEWIRYGSWPKTIEWVEYIIEEVKYIHRIKK